MVKPNERLQNEGDVKMAYHCGKFSACCFLSWRNNSTLNIFLCRPTMTLHQVKVIETSMSIICHARFGRHSLKTVRDMAIIVHV